MLKIITHVRNIFQKSLIPVRRVILYLSGVQFSGDCNIYGKIKVHIASTGKLYIGDQVTFASLSKFNPLCRGLENTIYVMEGAEIRIGNNVGISSACLWAKESIIIGDHVAIGAGTIILDNDCHSLDYKIRCGLATDKNSHADGRAALSKPIVVEDNVMIGANCILLKGVHIGARTIIGAGSVVTKSLPPDSIAAGNPCCIIRKKV